MAEQPFVTLFDGVSARTTWPSEKVRRLSEAHPNWRIFRYDNGAPMFARDGTMLDDDGSRSIFDDVDE